MISRDFTRRIGMPSGERSASKPATIAVLALVALGGVVFARQIFALKPGAEAGPSPVKASSR